MEGQDKEILDQIALLISRPISHFNTADKIFDLFKDSELKWYNEGWEDGWEDCQKELPSLDDIVANEKCETCDGGTLGCDMWDICPTCHGTNTIIRQAEWGDVDIKGMIKALQYHSNYQMRLKVKE